MARRSLRLAKGQGLLIRFPQVSAIFAIDDPTAIGLNLATHQLDRHGFFIASVDGSPDVVTEIKNPNSLIMLALVTAANAEAYTAWNTQPHAVTVAGP